MKYSISIVAILFTAGFQLTSHAQDLAWYAWHHGVLVLSENQFISEDAFGDVITAGHCADTITIYSSYDTSEIVPFRDTSMVVYIRKYDHGGHLLWQRYIDNTASVQMYGVETDSQGNIYAFGTFKGAVDFDLGDGESIIDSGADYYAYLIKLDPQGELQWVKTLVSDNSASIWAVAVDDVGTIYVSGSSNGNTDIDPGPGTVMHTNPNLQNDGIVLKLDSSGNYVWSYTLVSTPSAGEMISKMMIGPDGNIYATGNFMQNLDFDPGPGTTTLSGGSQPQSAFIFAVSPEMELQFAYAYNGSNARRVTGIDSDADGNIYISGTFPATIDVDLKTGVQMLIAQSGVNDAFIAKYNSDMDLLWVKQIGNTSADRLDGFCTSDDGMIYAHGSFSNEPIDIDPGPSTYMLQNSDYAKAYLMKMDADGNFLWARDWGGIGDSRPKDLDIGEDGSIYCIGYTQGTSDLDIQDGTFMMPADPDWRGSYVTVYTQNACSDFSVILDGTEDLLCNDSGELTATPYAGEAPFIYIWEGMPEVTTDTLTILEPGLFVVDVTDGDGCTYSDYYYIEGPVEGIVDVQGAVATGVFVPGFPNTMFIAATADDCLPMNGQIQLVLDSGMVFQEANPVPVSVNGDTITWDYTDLIYASDALMQLSLLTDVNLLPGDTLYAQMQILDDNPAEDVSNNVLNFTYPVMASYDPNMMQVQPEGWTNQGFVLPQQTLTYTVHFQNMGNYFATDVSIVDTISPNLKLQSFQVLSASDAYEIVLTSDRVVHIQFPDIYLSGTDDEPNSHGYVTFSLELEENLPPLSAVTNSAGIYFDFNVPVFTNTVLNTTFDCSLMTGNLDDNYALPMGSAELIDPQEIYFEEVQWSIDGELVSEDNQFATASLLPSEYTLEVVIANPLCTLTDEAILEITEPQGSCAVDFNNDGIVNVMDVTIFIGAYGCNSDCTVDSDNNGVTNVIDLIYLLAGFGMVCDD